MQVCQVSLDLNRQFLRNFDFSVACGAKMENEKNIQKEQKHVQSLLLYSQSCLKISDTQPVTQQQVHESELPCSICWATFQHHQLLLSLHSGCSHSVPPLLCFVPLVLDAVSLPLLLSGCPAVGSCGCRN